MAHGIQFEDRMSDADALMWHMEKDPLLRSTITVLWLLDRAPDPGRLHRKIDRATRMIPRLRQRVVSNPYSIAPPRWETDPHFDLGFHLRHISAPGDGSVRTVLDLMRPIAMQGFDRARPLWELSVIDGMHDGKAAMVMKLHHSLSDGVGLVRMTTQLVELAPEWDGSDAEPLPPLPTAQVMGQWERFFDAVAHERRRQLGRAWRLTTGIAGLARSLTRHPLRVMRDAGDLATSVGRLLQPATDPCSPIMRGRSLSVRFDLLTLPLDAMRTTAKRAGGKLNDAFVAGVAGGLYRYHHRHGFPVDALRMSMPINLRDGEASGRAGNQFAPARFLVPLDIKDPLARMSAIRDLVGQQRGEPALRLVDELTGILNRLPLAMSTAMFGGMLKGVDFVTSNVPGPSFPVYLAGARIEQLIGYGPLAGAGANITLFSYCGELNLGVNTDPAAVRDPDTFVDCLRQGFAELLGCGPDAIR